MSEHTEYQIIEHAGQPAFVLVPWEEFQRIRPILEAGKAQSAGIPQAVVEAHVLHDMSLIKAWREELGLTQDELARRLNVSQAAVAKFEQPNARPRMATLRKIAVALGITIEQLHI
ncbi:helix-turn-helix transcriptional regulator [Geomonas sp. Red69]|uniref:Helix-turn-helix transcriptional regulator n=1 Tax=Geomonas diazotrophica TaxID=2843197 RepID=A0ABX8JHX4_9BACT|nr:MULTISPECIES: helix-turn-helix transcriptional regulator [Geomonas]MBU5635792.1 helix-turn-helix transcriptional regulator [Geomonas diazotrophica]QWV97975.1 helix-turn-helix transcriptional regulator [Geomonas nitrogeniifigens]QXE87106.1 helix-turn-helix transcriptional regulator [Geomonas nitrogeniifigens]